ncbi:MAG: hypothetical protein AB7F43_11565 [Bacteriovoracia bacterium]
MKVQICRFLAVVVMVLGLFVVENNSEANFRIGLMAGPSIGTASSEVPTIAGFSTSNTGFPAVSYTAGLIGEYMFLSSFSAELGFFYLKRKFGYTSEISSGGTVASTSEVTAKYETWMIPLIFRYWLSNTMGLGLGGYYAKGFNSLSMSGSIKTGTSGPSTDFTATAPLDVLKADYGLVASFVYLYELTKMISLRGDARILFGLDDNKTSIESKTRLRDGQILVGAQISI